ncbi:hypothetical protein SLEP1_g18994 [Rubroshorea leprosula]|nr:hypothetical protein SLEP1_g18994 [Rubroshorea leprosula]
MKGLKFPFPSCSKNQVSGLEHSPKPRNFPDLRCLLPLCPPASAVWGWVRFSAP